MPDTRLLDKFSQITPQLFTPLDGTTQSPPLEILYILDFFIALAICNTVVVSAPNQPRQKVTSSANKGLLRLWTMWGLQVSVVALLCKDSA